MHRYVPKSHVQLIKQVYMVIHYVGFKIYVIGPTIDREERECGSSAISRINKASRLSYA